MAKSTSASASSGANTNRARGAQPGNTNARRHNVYSSHFTTDEVTRFLEAAFDSQSLADEIGVARIILDRVVAKLESTDAEEFMQLSKLALEASGRVGNLLRQQRTITGQAGDSLADAIATALDQIGEQLNIET